MAEGGMACVKYLLFFFNMIFLISGIALIAVGVVVKVAFGDYSTYDVDTLTTAAIFLVAVGVIVCFISVFGCCGAIKENYCMLMTFAVLLGIIFILEIAAGALAYSYRDQLKKLAKESIEHDIKHYKESEESKKAIDKLQTQFNCCGVNGPKDYKIGEVPKSCCNSTVSTCTRFSAYQDGCETKLEEEFRHNILKIGGVGIGVAFVEIFGIILACCLLKSVKNSYRYV